jgi:hypothetical protein
VRASKKYKNVRKGVMFMETRYYPEDWEENWEYTIDREAEFDRETACVECGEPGGCCECGCCGAPLCFMHAEVNAGFCSECLNDPDFDKKMEAIYRQTFKGQPELLASDKKEYRTENLSDIKEKP